MPAGVKIFLILFIMLPGITTRGQKQPVAEKGVLDLRKAEGAGKFYFNLNGEWEFYWNRFLYPSSFSAPEKPRPDIYGIVPSYWTDYSGEVKYSGKGYATYRLTVLIPYNFREPLAFDIPVFDSAFDLWVNDSLLFSNGQPGRNPETEKPEYRPGFKEFTPSSDTIQIVVNVSNFNHRRGGFWRPMAIGSFDIVKRSNTASWAIGFGAVSVITAFFLFFLIFFLLYPRDKTMLSFSIALLGMAIRPLFIGEYLIYDFTELGWTWVVRFEYISAFISVAGWSWYIYYLYPARIMKLQAFVFSVLYAGSIILVLLSPVKIFSYSVVSIYIGIPLLGAITIGCAVNGIARKRIIDLFQLFLFIFLIAGSLHDINVSLGNTSGKEGYIMPVVMVIFIFFQSVLILYKWVQEFYEKERLKERLEFLNRNLEEIVSNRTLELHSRNQEMEKKNKLIEDQNVILTETINIKNRLFSVIAHDLRSPVVNILYILNLIRDKEHKDNFDRFAESSINYAQMVINLLENMLVWGRGQEDKIKFSPAMNDLSSVILTNMSIYKEPADRKNISLNFVQKGRPAAFFDKDLMDIVIRNLLSNAVKYTGRGGKISIMLKEDTAGRKVSVSVCDNGTGMPEKKVKNIFEAGEITSTPGTENEKGTGIGLKLCYDLVKLNNGVIEVESKENEGSCFRVLLPTSGQT